MIIEALIGGIIGLILGVMFQSPLETFWHRIIKTLNRFFRSKKNLAYYKYNFMFGKKETSIRIVDGDGHRHIQKGNISTRISGDGDEAFELNPEILYFYDKVLAEFEDKKAEGKSVPWNGTVLSLYKYQISRTEDEEEYKIILYLQKTGYYKVYATINNLFERCPETGRKLIDYTKEFNYRSDEMYLLPNAIGMSLQVITKDQKTIFSVRSSESGFRAGESDASIVEGINALQDMVNHEIDFYKAAGRAFNEEICDADEELMEIALLGLVHDEKYNQWNIIGRINVNLTQEQIIQRRNSGTSGKWELDTLDFIPFRAKDIMLYLSTHPMWDMGLATVYFALVESDYYTKGKINEYIDKFYKMK